MEMLIRLSNELRMDFIKDQMQRFLKEDQKYSSESTEIELEQICITFLIKRKIKEIGIEKFIEEIKRTNSLHSFFKNSKN